MTTITVKNGEFKKTTFKNIEELQQEILLMNEKSELTTEQIKVLQYRENEVNKAIDSNYSWDAVKANLQRKNV